MLNPDESAIQIKKYLRKLTYIIDNQTVFTLLKVKIVKKKEVDDILCCIEASFPKEYNAYIKKNGAKRLRSAKFYRQLLESIRRKVWFDSNSYAVLYKDLDLLVNNIINTINGDLNQVFKSEADMF